MSPDLLAVSKNGRAAYTTYCPGSSMCLGSSNQGAAIEACEKQSRGVACVIYGINGKLLFEPLEAAASR